ncbi:MAG: DNA-3-methyladenine glycosylase [Gammaproteobacteria bacterium]|nr:DNA-3-methyladenine glycosylase [Gammaproteobacteria bacterium]
MLTQDFFNRHPCLVAKSLLGKVIQRLYKGVWLCVQIIETEAYNKNEKGSHSSLGYSHSRRALFMPAGTLYLYYARGKDSLNISTSGEGDAVLIKSAFPYGDKATLEKTIPIMQAAFPLESDKTPRPISKLCSGQTLLCQALRLKVSDWNTKTFDSTQFFIEDLGIQPEKIIQTQRLGIPKGRDEHLPYRFVDYAFARVCTKKP